jgi:hypothetical protein
MYKNRADDGMSNKLLTSMCALPLRRFLTSYSTSNLLKSYNVKFQISINLFRSHPFSAKYHLRAERGDKRAHLTTGYALPEHRFSFDRTERNFVGGTSMFGPNNFHDGLCECKT